MPGAGVGTMPAATHGGVLHGGLWFVLQQHPGTHTRCSQKASVPLDTPAGSHIHQFVRSKALCQKWPLVRSGWAALAQGVVHQSSSKEHRDSKSLFIMLWEFEM